MRITSVRNIIFALESIFSSYGIPNDIVSENDPPFTLYQLQGYFVSKGTKHHKTCLFWPQGNGQLEIFMSLLNRVSQTSFLERKVGNLKYVIFLSLYYYPSYN